MKENLDWNLQTVSITLNSTIPVDFSIFILLGFVPPPMSISFPRCVAIISKSVNPSTVTRSNPSNPSLRLQRNHGSPFRSKPQFPHTSISDQKSKILRKHRNFIGKWKGMEGSIMNVERAEIKEKRLMKERKRAVGRKTVSHIPFFGTRYEKENIFS